MSTRTPMTQLAVADALADRPAWALVHDRLVREHDCGSWDAAFALLAPIAAAADRLDHHPDRRLDNPITDHGYTQRSLLSLSGLLDPGPSDRLGPVSSIAQLALQKVYLAREFSFELLTASVVHSRRAFIANHCPCS